MLKILYQMNDKVAIQAQEEITKSQPFGTGRKMVREFYVLERKSKGETVHTFGTPVSILSPSRPVGGAGVKTIRNAAPCWGCGDMNLIPMKIK